MCTQPHHLSDEYRIISKMRGAPSPGPASQFCWAILTEVDVWLVLATGSIVSQYTDTGEELQVMGETPRVFHQYSS